MLYDKLPQHLLAQNYQRLIVSHSLGSREDEGNSSTLIHVNWAAGLRGQTKQKYPRVTPRLAVDAGCWLRCQLESRGSPLRGLSKRASFSQWGSWVLKGRLSKASITKGRDKRRPVFLKPGVRSHRTLRLPHSIDQSGPKAGPRMFKEKGNKPHLLM